MKKIISLVLLLCGISFQIGAQTDLVGSGRCLQFDAVDDYIDLGNIYDDVSLPLTISAWVYRDESDEYILPIFASQDNASIYNGFWFCLSATNLFFEYGDGRGDQHPAYRKGKSAALPNMENRWIYVSAVVTSSSNIQLYANGHNIGGAIGGSSDQPMASNFPGDVAKIGYLYTNSVVHRFEGMIDELRIWNRALSENEIRQTMCSRLNGEEPNLIGYWNFDETSGNEVKDGSPNQFHGTLKGNPIRVFSGAPVGDESVYLYAGNWSGMSLSKDDVLIQNISGTPYGVHIYSVNTIPSQSGGLNAADVQLPYHGVFLADEGQLNTFDLTFTGNNVCESFKRNDNSESQWHATNDFSAIATRIEIILAFKPSGLDVDLGDNTFVCDETSRVLEAADDPSGKTFLWNDGQTSHNISVTASGQYSVEVKQGCLVDRDTIQMSFASSPPAFSLGQNEELCVMEPRTLTANVRSNVETSEFDMTWQDGSKGASFVAAEFGTYWLRIKNACGVSVDSITFDRKMYADPEHYNFISPNNGDDRNQFFALDERLRGSRLQVFNRWGKPVYQSLSYQNNWDGRGLPAGIYFYTVNGECIEPQKGSLTIMR